DHDSLTSLLSRRAILAELDRCVSDVDSVGLVYGDVDFFKSINDRFGHLAGDHLLTEVARRMRVLIDESALQVAPGRLGGDEFLCVVAGCTERELVEFTERLEFTMQAPMSIGTVTLSATMSWGVAIRPRHSDIDSSELLREADVALYQVKRNGRNALRLYDDELRAWTVERKRMETDLATSISTRSGVHADFQPQYDQNLQLIGFEALGRWHRQGIGVVAPPDFIPIAVEGGLMADFDAEIFRHVVQVLGGYRREGRTFGTVSINVSAERLERSDFVDSTLSMLRTAAVDPRDIVLEITESSLLRDLSERGRRLEELQRWGMRIAIDDFGTGYSSLSYLRELPVDIVKLDKEFVADIETSSESRAIVEAIMALAQALDLKVVAEGVERRQQYEILHGFGCDIYQGFLFGRALQRGQARDHAESAWPLDPQMRGFEWSDSPSGLSGLYTDAPAFSFSSAPLH
ncbi:MAG: bifunctional diguanylate cyclase/phosphodiesterase, partial [Acidimicrobiia bacterium]|nr:bifunctional diguanylate cyclase/phosphodiesterase [Acidimicrobiia bacterium]